MMLEQFYIACLVARLVSDRRPNQRPGNRCRPTPGHRRPPGRRRQARRGDRGVINTHFHADFVAGHLEVAAATGAWIAWALRLKPTTRSADWSTANASRWVRWSWRSSPRPSTPGSRSVCWCAMRTVRLCPKQSGLSDADGNLRHAVASSWTETASKHWRLNRTDEDPAGSPHRGRPSRIRDCRLRLGILGTRKSPTTPCCSRPPFRRTSCSARLSRWLY